MQCLLIAHGNPSRDPRAGLSVASVQLLKHHGIVHGLGKPQSPETETSIDFESSLIGFDGGFIAWSLHERTCSIYFPSDEANNCFARHRVMLEIDAQLVVPLQRVSCDSNTRKLRLLVYYKQHHCQVVDVSSHEIVETYPIHVRLCSKPWLTTKGNYEWDIIASLGSSVQGVFMYCRTTRRVARAR